MRKLIFAAATCALLSIAGTGAAENLYEESGWAAMGADRRAARPGDLLTVIILQAAEASNSAQNNSRRSNRIGGRLGAAGINEGAELEFGGSYSGRGEVRRSERLAAQITVAVLEVLPNGDLVVSGEQWLRVNGETTRIGVRGRVRQEDVNRDNAVLSSRIADAQIDYDGRGFVSRSARPGVVSRIFSFLGLM